MKKYFFLFIALGLFSVSNAQQRVSGVELPEQLNLNEQKLLYNGGGVREKLWIDLYVAALYLQEKSSDTKQILTSNKPMSVRLHIVSKLITSKKMIDAVEEGFRNSTNGNTASIRKRIDSFIEFFKEEIVKGDEFDLLYIPGKGTIAYKNGVKKGEIAGLDFKAALFGIWLSNKAADDDLKEKMLGK